MTLAQKVQIASPYEENGQISEFLFGNFNKTHFVLKVSAKD